MRQKSVPTKDPAEEVIKAFVGRPGGTFRRKTRSVLEGLRGEASIAELCRREAHSMTRSDSLTPTLPIPLAVIGSVSSARFRPPGVEGLSS